MFNNRQKLIISYLQRKQIATSKELANFLNVSSRTIKNDIELIREMDLPWLSISSQPGTGYSLLHADQEKLKNFPVYYKYKDFILQNYDRIAIIINVLLTENDFVTVDHLLELLFVSESTLFKDINIVREFLNDYDLSLTYETKKGFKVVGEEYNRRKAIKYFLFSSFWSVLNVSDYPSDYSLYQENSDVIKNVIRKHVNSDDYDEAMIDYLTKITFISLVRREQFVYLSNDSLFKEDLDKASKILSEVRSLSLVDLKFKKIELQREAKYLAHYLNGLRINPSQVAVDFQVISAICVEIVKEIQRNFDLDFSKDQVLAGDLQQAISLMLHRIHQDTVLEENSMFVYYKDYLFASKITISAVNIFEKMTNLHVPSSEYTDLIIIFEAALKRSVKPLKIGTYARNHTENTLISSFLQNCPNSRYEISFLENLEQTGNYDLVVTNSSLRERDDNILKKDFTKEFLENFNVILDDYFLNKQETRLEKYISPESMLVLKETSNKEIKEKIIKHLKESNYLKEDKNYNFIYHEIGNRVVHIQDLYKVIDKSICLLVILETPVLWNRTMVEYLVLIKTKKDGDSDLYYLCDVFSNLINNPSALSQIKCEPIVENLENNLN